MAELTTIATGDTWHEAVYAAVDEATELLGDAEVWRVNVEPITTLRVLREEPRVAWYRATVTSRPRDGHAANKKRQQREAHGPSTHPDTLMDAARARSRP